MSLLSNLSSFSQKRISWLLLLIFIVLFLSTALFFQHILMLPPCVMCIYERVAMVGIALAAGIGLIKPQNSLLRWSGLILWGASATKGLLLALDHVYLQFTTSAFAYCDIFVSFPEWLPLHKWFPFLFEPNNMASCSKITWQFLSLSIPQWLVVIFATNLVTAFFIVIAQFTPKRRKLFS